MAACKVIVETVTTGYTLSLTMDEAGCLFELLNGHVAGPLNTLPDGPFTRIREALRLARVTRVELQNSNLARPGTALYKDADRYGLPFAVLERPNKENK